MEVKLRKALKKIRLYLLKIIPVIISVLYLANTIFCFYDSCIEIISAIGGISILSWIYLYISSWSEGFCTYHRMFLYYILIDEMLAWYDYKIGVPISDKSIIAIHLILYIIMLIIVVKLKLNYEKRIKRTGSKATNRSG